ncbi:MAG: hypothetical protein KC560_07865 [Myxococcales bacterium]|nr:hypothetical protein [Myxococcales bacterium]
MTAPARREGLRIAVAGASGAVGSELVAVLGERRFPVAELLPFATDRSLGRDVEIDDEVIAIEAEAPPLRGLDLLFVCTPRGAALDLVRAALRAEVACIDCSGALARSAEVPLGLADRSPAAELVGAPLVAAPSGPALAWGRVLAALDDAAGVERVTGTVLQSAAHAGRDGIEALSDETVAVLAQQEPPEPAVFAGPVAFDCLPRETAAEAEADEDALAAELARVVARILGRDVPLDAAFVQVPAFVGEASALTVELRRALSPEQAREVLAKTAGVALHPAGDALLAGPTLRDAAGSDDVLVGGVRRDRAHANGLALWLVADPVRIAASNAVKLAEARTQLH